ncbi:DUF5801 repeats-in-toxin domain-containing protein, partial [Croceicoccus ponticola]
MWGKKKMDFQSNGSNSENATSGLTEATPIFNGTSSVKRVIADPARENVLVLPAGVSLDDIDVRGDDLVIKLPDGTEMIVINGAIYMPEIVINGVTVPPMNLAALLDSDVPEPAAGNPRSSGGNFADAVNPIDPAYDIGDLLPYTELFFPEQQSEEIIPYVVNEPPENLPAFAVVSEEGLASGNPDGNPAGSDSTDSASFSGQFEFTDPNGDDLTYSISAPLDVFYAADGTEVVWSSETVDGIQTLTGTAGEGGDTVIHVVLNTATGEYDVFLDGPVFHGEIPGGDGNIEGAFDIVFPVTVDDGTESVPTSLTVTIEDDSPEAGTGSLGEDVALVDESPLSADGIRSASFNVIDNFPDASAGGDGLGSTSYALALSTQSIASGLFTLGTDGAAGDPILLYQQADGTVIGYTGADPEAPDAVYFTIAVNNDPTDATNDADGVFGDVTFTQLDNVWHPDAGDNSDGEYDEPVSLALPEGETIDVVLTVTDADGDFDTASFDIAGAFTIEDDGPEAGTGSLGEDVALVDESPLAPGGDGIRSASFNVIDNFTGSDFGTDGAGSTSYALALSTQSIASGLFTLGTDGAAGDPILLYQQADGTVIGYTGADPEAPDAVYFTIAVNNDPTDATNDADGVFGDVTFTQLDNVWHPDAGDNSDGEYDEPVSLALPEGETIDVVLTVTDADGDFDTASFDIAGAFTIEDDGP